jgi:2-haloacid dehalogenase
VGNDLSAGHRETLISCYTVLPAYPGAAAALALLKEPGFSSYAFSNRDSDKLATFFRNAGLESLIDGVVSVQGVRGFMSVPAVDAHFCSVVESRPKDTWLISGNPFDAIGASNCGWRTAWFRRNPAQSIDPCGCDPTEIADHLSELTAFVG